MAKHIFAFDPKGEWRPKRKPGGARKRGRREPSGFRCPEPGCGTEMSAGPGAWNFRNYVDGFDLRLEGIAVHTCDNGHSFPVIPDLAGLHEAVATRLRRGPVWTLDEGEFTFLYKHYAGKPPQVAFFIFSCLNCPLVHFTHRGQVRRHGGQVWCKGHGQNRRVGTFLEVLTHRIVPDWCAAENALDGARYILEQAGRLFPARGWDLVLLALLHKVVRSLDARRILQALAETDALSFREIAARTAMGAKTNRLAVELKRLKEKGLVFQRPSRLYEVANPYVKAALRREKHNKEGAQEWHR